MKRKFFTSIAIFFALAITACQPAQRSNDNNSEEAPVS